MSIELISCHVQKCAGNSFKPVLFAKFGQTNVHFDYWEEESTFPGPEIPAAATCVHGHFPLSRYRKLFPFAKTATWLRHPRSRLVSHYYFARALHGKLEGSAFDEFYKQEDNKIAIHGTFRDYIQYEGNRNYISKRYFQSIPLSEFDFVGITEDYAIDVKRFAWLSAGQRDLPEHVFHKKLNTTGEHASQKLIQERNAFRITPEEEELFNKLNREDLSLYDKARNVAASQRRAHELYLRFFYKKRGLMRKLNFLTERV